MAERSPGDAPRPLRGSGSAPASCSSCPACSPVVSIENADVPAWKATALPSASGFGARGCRQDPQPGPDHPGGSQCAGRPLHADGDVRRRRQGVLRRVARTGSSWWMPARRATAAGKRRRSRWTQRGSVKSARPAWMLRLFTHTSWSRPSSSVRHCGAPARRPCRGQNLRPGSGSVLKVWASDGLRCSRLHACRQCFRLAGRQA